MSAYVIADIGACHDGSYDKMLRACRAASAAGVNALKFQFTSDPLQMARRRGRAADDGYAEIYERYLYWPAKQLACLAKECRHMGLDFMCTAFLPADVAVVAPHVKHFKVASFEADDQELVAAYLEPLRSGPADRLLMVSLGMGAEARHLPKTFRHSYTQLAKVRTLRCVSSYPAPAEALQLAAFWPHGYDCDPAFHGLSDHTDPVLTWTGALAVAAQAKIVEAHLRLLETDTQNPDYPHAMTPAQFAEYVRNIRFAERCLGDGTLGAQPCEEAMMRYRVGAPRG